MTFAGTRHAADRWIVLAVLLAITPAAVAQSERPIDEDHWYVVHMQGERCGYMHATVKGVGDEVNTRTHMQLEIARGPTKLEIGMEQAFRETLAGKPLGFKHTMTMGTEPTTTSGTIKGDKVVLITEQFGVKREATYDFDPEVRFAWGQSLLQKKYGFEPGTTYTIKTYEPNMKADGPIVAKIEIHPKESIDVLGKKRKLTRLTMTLQLPTPIPSETWVDDDANPIVTTVNMGIISLKVIETTKKQALGETEAPELFFSTFVQTNRRIAEDAKAVKLRLRATGDHKLPKLPKTGMQSVKRVSDREMVVTLRRIDWEKLRAVGAESESSRKKMRKKMKTYLRASTMCDTNDKRIKRLTKKAVKGCKTPAEKADGLRRFVTKYVNDKSLDVGFATASEVARTREGDCSEHGVLLAALARVAGLPARGVSGIVQIPEDSALSGKGGAFGYHMWTQVYIDKKWVDIDAAMRQTDCDPTHIALALMPLNDEGMLDSAMSLLSVLGQLEIEVLDVEE